ncbi:MAG: hypothetical protein ACOYXA_15260 [Bacteroidota bacterium]
MTVQGIDKTALDDGESGLLSSYTAEMRKVIDAFGNSTPAADTYYLFIVEGAKDKNKMGYMPRKKQAGFLFTSAIPNEYFAHTLAHELGHGAFRLEHTFEEYATLGERNHRQPDGLRHRHAPEQIPVGLHPRPRSRAGFV